jgi:hypothetical protein
MRVSTALRTVIAAIAITACAVSAQYGQYSSRSLLHKKIFFLDENGKSDTCGYWALFLGTFPLQYAKTYPGEGEIKLKAEINYSFLSSMYIEGKGYSNRGKVEAAAEFAVAGTDAVAGGSVVTIEPGAIDFVCNGGQKIKTHDGVVTDLILFGEKTPLTINRLILRKFYYNTEYSELKYQDDAIVEAFSFTKEGLQRAIAEMKRQ